MQKIATSGVSDRADEDEIEITTLLGSDRSLNCRGARTRPLAYRADEGEVELTTRPSSDQSPNWSGGELDPSLPRGRIRGRVNDPPQFRPLAELRRGVNLTFFQPSGRRRDRAHDASPFRPFVEIATFLSSTSLLQRCCTSAVAGVAAGSWIADTELAALRLASLRGQGRAPSRHFNGVPSSCHSSWGHQGPLGSACTRCGRALGSFCAVIRPWPWSDPSVSR